MKNQYWPSSYVAERAIDEFTSGNIDPLELADLRERGLVPACVNLSGNIGYELEILKPWVAIYQAIPERELREKMLKTLVESGSLHLRAARTQADIAQMLVDAWVGDRDVECPEGVPPIELTEMYEFTGGLLTASEFARLDRIALQMLDVYPQTERVGLRPVHVVLAGRVERSTEYVVGGRFRGVISDASAVYDLWSVAHWIANLIMHPNVQAIPKEKVLRGFIMSELPF